MEERPQKIIIETTKAGMEQFDTLLKEKLKEMTPEDWFKAVQENGIMYIDNTNKNIRMTGRTIRKANELIEELFIRGTVTAQDHEDHPYAHICMLDRLILRMRTEHKRHKIEIDRDRLTITLKGF